MSSYFQKAHELSQTNVGIKNYDGGKFTNILLYHSIYFGAMGYFVLAQDELKKVGDTSKGQGMAISYLRKTLAEFDKAKPVVALIPSNYQENFNTKYADAVKLRDKAVKDNQTIYFEPEVAVDKIPRPDMQNFVKMEALVDSLTGKLPIEEKLRHIVPPNVRAMQVELKGKLQEVINQMFEGEQKTEADQKKFLTQYGLPQAYHAATSTTEIPATLWEKIEDFQKKGGHGNVQAMIQGIGAVRNNNHEMIQQMHKMVDEEEALDNQLRGQYREKWGRMPSQSLNVQFKTQLQDYSSKANMAESTDRQVEDKFSIHGESLKLLNKTRNELSALIPQSQGSKEISQNPAVVAITQSLDMLDQLKEQRSPIL